MWKRALTALGALLALQGAAAAASVAHAGGAGHSLLLRDHALVIEGFNDLAPDAFTFESWVRTSDSCHRSGIFSYAAPLEDPAGAGDAERTAAANHFTIFDPDAVLACHDFEFIDLWPDLGGVSCVAAWNYSAALPSVVEPSGRWHHLAVTWTAADAGLTRIYVDGLLRAETPSGKTAPLRPGGALMLGGEQDCYGGCVDRGQGFRGEMDEVRVWRVACTQAQILEHMRDGGGGAGARAPLEGHPDLAAYWRLNDPGEAPPRRGTPVAADASGRGNHLRLVTLPAASRAAVAPALPSAGALAFRNSYAMNAGVEGMPGGDFTVEFWARTPALNASAGGAADVYSEFFNYGAAAGDAFLDDAILIERYSHEFRGTAWVDYRQDVSTAGALSVHVNANRQGMGGANDHWMDYAVGWTDDRWHHVAVTWARGTGETGLYFDGAPQVPFWRSAGGAVEAASPAAGGVPRTIAAGTDRPTAGSLVLGSKQETLGGGFSPQYSLHGEMSTLRVWDRVLSAAEVGEGMSRLASNLTSTAGLAFSYEFNPEAVELSDNGATGTVRDGFTGRGQHLYLGADAPLWVFSSAPLEAAGGRPAAPPAPGPAGHALRLSDRQALVLAAFADFPADQLTLEFWMLSTDGCRAGAPFSYAAGGYGALDNAFLLFDYNDWGVAVMEDEGTARDHSSGVGSTDGRWAHVALTWRSADGDTRLFLNGRPAWQVTRAAGRTIPSGGTLVVGRDQDCPGGCFDSDWGAAGPVSDEYDQEYGAQDFFGLLDEMRLWRVARDGAQIAQGMHAKLGRAKSSAAAIDPAHPDLVAYWTFDEGEGHVVHDATGRGHDLRATQPAVWEVVSPAAVCGNGVLEAGEECDTGALGDAPGCSKDCTVWRGWTCTQTSPSRCWRGGAGEGGAAAGGGGTRSGGCSALRAVAATLAGVAAAGAVVAAAAAHREALYDRFPTLEAAVAAAQAGAAAGGTAVVSRLSGVLDRASAAAGAIRGGGGGGAGYTYAGDLEEPLEAGGSPAFTRTVPPPERAGYSPLSGD